VQINRDFWSGNTRKITDSNSRTIVEFLDNSLYTDIYNDTTKYQGVEWDKSASPWKINYQSDFFRLDFMLGYNAGYQEPVTVATTPFFKERKKGYTFYLSSNGGNNMSGAYARLFPVWLGTLSRSDLDLTDNVVKGWIQGKYKELHPVIDFDYSKIFAVPTLQSKNEGSRTLFRESLRASWNPSDWSGIGVQFLYKNGSTTLDLALEIVSLNNTFGVPTWDTTDCFNSEQYDNGMCITCYDRTGGNYYYRPMIGERFQLSGANGTYFNPNSYATVDAAGAVSYYANREIWVNSPNGDNNSICDNTYYGGFISGDLRPYRRTFKTGLTFDDLADYLKTQLAYLGFRFCIDGDQISQSIDSQYFFIPEIDSKGVTTGNYSAANAPEAENYANYTWTTDVYSVTPYDGTDDDEGGDPNEYDEDNQTVLNSEAYKAKNYFFNVYAVSTTQLKQLSEYMYSDMPTDANQDNFLTNNAIDVIVSLMMFPIDFTAISTVDYLTLGKLQPTYYDEEAHEDKRIFGWIPNRNIVVYPCGSCTYYPVYGVDDFRNYEPYCTAELELPYCGNIKLPTSVYLNHTIRVTYLIDLITGSCMALVFRDDLVYTTAQGQMGVQFPLSGIQSQDLQASIMRKQTQYGESLINVARSVIGGGISIAGATQAASTTGGLTGTLGAVTGVASAFNQLEQAEYNIEHIQVPFTMHGASSPLTSFANEQYPRLIVKRPRMLPEYDPVAYGHISGFACNITGALSEFSGLTVCATANLDGIAATESEKQLIRRALLEGVIL